MKDDELLEQYNRIWDKVSNSMKKECDSEPIYNEKYLKTKIKSYERKISPNFRSNKAPKEGSQCICLSVILIDSDFRTCKNYYLRVFLDESQYNVKEKKIPKYVTDGLEISFDTENSDEKNYSEKSSDDETYGKLSIIMSFFERAILKMPFFREQI